MDVPQVFIAILAHSSVKSEVTVSNIWTAKTPTLLILLDYKSNPHPIAMTLKLRKFLVYLQILT